MRQVPKRQTNENIVIVCEGSDTEYNYFNRIKEYIASNGIATRYADIKVLPYRDEAIDDKKKKGNRRHRALVNIQPYRYYTQTEHDEATYNTFKQQPTRYVREAKLFIEENGYTEGWAVFDKDVHPDHAHAFQYAQEAGIRIAFSSYSFEEWILCHYERNCHAFSASECKSQDNRKKKLGCDFTHGCRGNECIGGYLRAKGYVANYSKTESQTFVPQLIEKATINAAWLRSLSNQPIYLRNPYCDVDYLVNRLLGIDKEYVWIPLGGRFVYENTYLSVVFENKEAIVTNDGQVAIIIPCLMFFDESGNSMLNAAFDCQTHILNPKDKVNIKVPIGAAVLSLHSGAMQYFFDLC